MRRNSNAAYLPTYLRVVVELEGKGDSGGRPSVFVQRNPPFFHKLLKGSLVDLRRHFGEQGRGGKIKQPVR